MHEQTEQYIDIGLILMNNIVVYTVHHFLPCIQRETNQTIYNFKEKKE